MTLTQQTSTKKNDLPFGRSFDKLLKFEVVLL